VLGALMRLASGVDRWTAGTVCAPLAQPLVLVMASGGTRRPYDTS